MIVKLDYQLPPLSDENKFQEFISDLFKLIYKTRSFKIFGKKGNKQKDINIYSQKEKIAIQCKKKDM